MTTPSQRGQLPINGLDLYYEVYGELTDSGPVPLLLIPGGFMATDSMNPWVAAFSAARPVIIFDQQGHGRTPDTARELSYPTFADDAAALLRALRVTRADVLGYSQGVALQLAVRHPTLVGKLISLSSTYRRDGWYPSVARVIAALSAAGFAGTPVEQAFRAHTPDPAAFAAFVEKMKKMGIEDHQIGDDELRAIPAPTMIIIGDTDAVRPEHALAMFRLRGGGDDEEAAGSGTLREAPAARLVIMPATSHLSILEKSAVLAPMISEFLDDRPV